MAVQKCVRSGLWLGPPEEATNHAESAAALAMSSASPSSEEIERVRCPEEEGPVLQTKSLLGFLIAPWHVDFLLALWNDPMSVGPNDNGELIAVFSRSNRLTMADPEGPPTTREDFLETWKSLPEADTAGRYFVFFTRDTHQPVGYSAFYDYDSACKYAETANCVANEWKGRGFGTEVMAAACEYAFHSEHFRCHSVFCTVVESNVPGWKGDLRCGFKKVGLRRETHFLKGSWHNEFVLDMLEADLEEAKQKEPILQDLCILRDV